MLVISIEKLENLKLIRFNGNGPEVGSWAISRFCVQNYHAQAEYSTLLDLRKARFIFIKSVVVYPTASDILDDQKEEIKEKKNVKKNRL